MRPGLGLLCVGALSWLVVDGVSLLSPAETVSGFAALSDGLSLLSLAGHLAVGAGAGLLLRHRAAPFGLALLCAVGWCVGWLLWRTGTGTLPLHPDLIAFVEVTALCVGLLRWVFGARRALLAAAALLSLTPFAATIVQAGGTAVSTTAYFGGQLLGGMALLAALAIALRHPEDTPTA